MRPARRSLATAIGNEDIRAIVRHLMDTSPDTLDSVADKVFAAAERGDFMIIPTRREPMRWRLKRWFPEFYFRQLQKRTGVAAKVIAEVGDP